MTNLAAAQAALARAQAARASAQYQQGQTLTVSPGQLVILLYEGAQRFVRRARAALAEGEMEQVHGAICRVQDIIAELDATLDDRAGAISLNLHRIYEYLMRRLITANVAKDDAALAEVLQHLEGLTDAWRSAIEQVERGEGQPHGQP